MRLPAQIALDYCVEVDQPDVPIAPNMLISLIENTFKHGVLAGQTCRIQICQRVKQGRLQLLTKSPFHPVKVKTALPSACVILNRGYSFCTLASTILPGLGMRGISLPDSKLTYETSLPNY
jgi:hypothetical protein